MVCLRSVVISSLIAALAGCRTEHPRAPLEVSGPTAPPAEAPRPAADALMTPHQGVKRLGREAWYGLYFGSKKVGHAELWDRRTREGEPGAYAVGFSMRMSVGGLGQANELVADELRFYGAEAPHALVETRFFSTAMGFRDERVAVPVVVDGKSVMRISRSIDGKPQPTREVAGSADNLIGQFAIMPVSLEGLEVGKTLRASAWNWEQEADESVAATVREVTTRRRAGIDERIATIDISYEATGLKGTSFIAADGTMLEMTVGPALVMKLEEQAVAKSGVTGLDILGTGLKSPVKLGPPGTISGLELVVSGPPITIPSSARQTVVPGPAAEGARRTQTIRIVRGPADAVTEAERAEALLEDAVFDLSHPLVKGQLETILAGLPKDAGESDKIRAIARWVYENLDKRLATHLPTASKILEKRVGDCTEHTWLTVALMRAAKIPARPAYGVAYTGDVEAVFAYHAWVEVAIDGRWVDIDPTWGQATADATHLSFGKTLGEVSASLGGLEIISAKIVDP